MPLLPNYVIASGSPDITKWFFEELKYRATPELQEIDPNVNLAAICEQIDGWQKESGLMPQEMTNKKLEEYLHAAKGLLYLKRRNQRDLLTLFKHFGC